MNSSNNSNNTLLFQITKEELMQDFEQVLRKVVNQIQVEIKSQNEKQTYTRKETAELLDVTVETLHYWKKKGILMPSAKVGKRVYYSKDTVLSRLKGE
ncbi:MerR family transcriptional regulator [Chryseobacterium sp. MHB01]|uniref:MerR family transcriptional regulator n=1 Tax=Chryseobacterium sp. MHB01 TaxID=3109433 RepID=UPI002AFE20ED|nr:MerR family transcriptional regulator [Chryseobacterium sp. MHB01]MEA1847505.1 MerR family transcriptional regulator [Chryseobacterium sp. MHB01]